MFSRWLPASLLGRLSLVMVAGVLVTQLAASVIWATQLRAKAEVESKSAAQYLAHSVSSSLRFFRSLPPNYRTLLIQQFHDMGGTRFFINLNHAYVPVQPIAPHALAQSVLGTIAATLKADLPHFPVFRLDFAWPDQLVVSPDGVRVGDLPDAWVQHILLIQPEPAPVLVIQTEIEPGNWLYLATLMPNPYFLNSNDPLSADRLALQGLSLAAVLLLSILVVRSITRPLAALSDAAEAFGKEEHLPTLPETGSREFVTTARAFSAMRQRIARYIEDRERLFISISHDLRTPITRLKLRAELLDNALFYGERAEISVQADEGAIAISVRDHGPGVPEDAFASLFEPYVRLAHGREQNDGGMGLGLGIARGIIEAHGGALLLSNHPDGGLNAVIRLPA